MSETVHDRLTAQFESHEIVRQLHDVPPHEVYEVRVDGQRAAYKGDTGPTGSAAVEGRLTAFVGRETSVPVPEVLHVGDDHYVAAWCPDAPDPDAERVVTERWVRAAGRGLATLHDESVPAIDRYGQFRVDAENPRIDGLAIDGHDDWAAAAVDSVEQYRPTLDAHGHGDVADAVREFLAERPDVFEGAGDPVCCHGWATPEHVAVDDGEVACVVDFEHAVAAPGEYDYWRTVMPTFDEDTGEERRAFREGYESVRPFQEGFEDRSTFYALLNEVYYFESLYVQDQYGPEKTEDLAEFFRESVFEKLDGRT